MTECEDPVMDDIEVLFRLRKASSLILHRITLRPSKDDGQGSTIVVKATHGVIYLWIPPCLGIPQAPPRSGTSAIGRLNLLPIVPVKNLTPVLHPITGVDGQGWAALGAFLVHLPHNGFGPTRTVVP